MKYTAGQAAKATGVATATITRALKSGKISGSKDENGAWVIDPAELHRVFPPLAAQWDEKPSTKQDETPNETGSISALEREIELLRESLSDARQERNKWQAMAERLSISPPAPEPQNVDTMLGFWARLFGKR